MEASLLALAKSIYYYGEFTWFLSCKVSYNSLLYNMDTFGVNIEDV